MTPENAPQEQPSREERETCRQLLRDRLHAQAERSFFQMSRSLNCEAAITCAPGKPHPRCIGNRWRTTDKTEVGCLCECHEPLAEAGQRQVGEPS